MAEALVGVSVAVETGHHSGEFAEAAEVAIRDHGGNEYWRGSADDYAAGKAPAYRIPTRLVATRLGAVRRSAWSEIVADYYDETSDREREGK